MYKLDEKTFVGTSAERTGNNFKLGSYFIDQDTGKHYVKLLAGIWLTLLGTSDPLTLASLTVTTSATVEALTITTSGTLAGNPIATTDMLGVPDPLTIGDLTVNNTLTALGYLDVGTVQVNDDITSPTGSITAFETATLTVSNVINYTGTMGSGTGDPTTDAPVDWIEVQIGGVTRYIPVYN